MIGVGIERLGPALGRPEIPGGLEERHETGIVERQDRFEPVFGRGLDRRNPSSAWRSPQDRFGSLRDVGRGALHSRLHGIGRRQSLCSGL